MSHRDLKADLLCLPLEKQIEIRDLLNDVISKSEHEPEDVKDELSVLGVWNTFSEDEKAIIVSHVCGEYEYDIKMKTKDGIIGKALAAEARYMRRKASEYMKESYELKKKELDKRIGVKKESDNECKE
jgi:hypothetical protein